MTVRINGIEYEGSIEEIKEIVKEFGNKTNSCPYDTNPPLNPKFGNRWDDSRPYPYQRDVIMCRCYSE